MEGVEENEKTVPETVEVTAGNSAPATPAPTLAVSVAPWAKPQPPTEPSAVDKLHMGNAVAQAETPLERNLREMGIKEALPHQAAAPLRSQAQPPLQGDGDLPRIRTYAADMSQEMEKRGSTLSSIISAEKTRPQQVLDIAPVPNKSRRIILIIGAGLFVLVGIGTVVVALFFSRTSSVLPEPLANLIPANQRVSSTVADDVPLSETLAGEKIGARLNLGEVEAIALVKNGIALSPGEVLSALGAPDALARNATNVLVGVHAFNHMQPFIIVSVSAYDLSFQAMLAWEKTIGANLGNFFAPSGVSTPHPPVLTFTDRVLANIDTRKSQDEWPMLYAFPSQNLLVITTSESTLREILTRLSLQKASNQ